MMVNICHSFMPLDPVGLLVDSVKCLLHTHSVENSLERVVSLFGKGSGEKSLLRAVIYGCIGDEKANPIIGSEVMFMKRLKRLHDKDNASSDEERSGMEEEKNEVTAT